MVNYCELHTLLRHIAPDIGMSGESILLVPAAQSLLHHSQSAPCQRHHRLTQAQDGVVVSILEAEYIS